MLGWVDWGDGWVYNIYKTILSLSLFAYVCVYKGNGGTLKMPVAVVVVVARIVMLYCRKQGHNSTDQLQKMAKQAGYGIQMIPSLLNLGHHDDEKLKWLYEVEGIKEISSCWCCSIRQMDEMTWMLQGWPMQRRKLVLIDLLEKTLQFHLWTSEALLAHHVI